MASHTLNILSLLITTFTTFAAAGVNSHRQPTLSQVLLIPNAVGPESLAFDRAGGGPYTGVSDGRILKWDAIHNRWVNFAITTPNRAGCEGPQDHVPTEARCGRPLGLSFNKRTGHLYIADAYKGLLVVGPHGGLAIPVATQAQGIPFKFTNDVVVDQNTGLVYFTDTSTRYQRSNYQAVLSTRDNTGRLLRYDPRANVVTVLANNLMFPNGVALSTNGDFLLITETTNRRVLRYWLSTGRSDVFAALPGAPDNIRRNGRGELWVAMNSGQGNYNGLGLVARLDQTGKILEVIQDKHGAAWRYASHVEEANGFLWIGSVVQPSVVKLRF